MGVRGHGLSSGRVATWAGAECQVGSERAGAGRVGTSSRCEAGRDGPSSRWGLMRRGLSNRNGGKRGGASRRSGKVGAEWAWFVKQAGDERARRGTSSRRGACATRRGQSSRWDREGPGERRPGMSNWIELARRGLACRIGTGRSGWVGTGMSSRIGMARHGVASHLGKKRAHYKPVCQRIQTVTSQQRQPRSQGASRP